MCASVINNMVKFQHMAAEAVMQTFIQQFIFWNFLMYVFFSKFTEKKRYLNEILYLINEKLYFLVVKWSDRDWVFRNQYTFG